MISSLYWNRNKPLTSSGLRAFLAFVVVSCVSGALYLWMPRNPHESFVEEFTPSLRPEIQTTTREHVVRAGDTLSRLALWYGVSVEELAVLNGLGDPDLIRIQQRLALPPRAHRSPPSADGAPALHLALDRAEAQLLQARFTEALRTAEAARQLVSTGASGAETLVRVEAIAAYIHAARGDEEDAVLAYRRLLHLDPQHSPSPSTPPKVRIAYERARARALRP